MDSGARKRKFAEAADAAQDERRALPAGVPRLLARKKARKGTSNDMVTTGVGKPPSSNGAPPPMSRLQPPPKTPPSNKSLLSRVPSVGLATGRPSAAMTLLRTPEDGPSPSPLANGYWAAFKTGLTPSLDTDARELEGVDDDVLPTVSSSAFTFRAAPPPTSESKSVRDDEDEDEDGHETASEEQRKLSWWEIAGRAFDTVFANVGWFFNYGELYLLETARLDAPPQYPKCVECVYFKKVPWDDAPAPEFRCMDCRGGEWCKECVRDVHRYVPFHRIERIVGGFWRRVRDKAALGIELQLMHPAGDACRVYDYARVDKFSVIDNTGIHRTRVQFCKCSRGRSVPRWAQLMRSRLWPSTSEDPKTATTFECLDMFSRLSMLGRLSGYDFHKAIEAATDGARVLGLTNLRKQFMRCSRQFQHVFLFKRAGRAHEEGGITGTPPGGCAIICPACPREGYNIPDDWRGRLFPWSYRMAFSTDANFRMSNRLTRSTESTDPCFNDGRAYMVPMKEYNAYVDSIDEAGKDEERADCSRFKAQGQANLKGGKGLRTTGVAGIFCARHEMWLPLGLAPLKKGERYSAIDFITAMAHIFVRVPVVVHSYDIVCQWHKNLRKRLGAVKKNKHASVFLGAAAALARTLIFVIPKFHIFGHIKDCFNAFNPSYTPGLAQLDGESCERVWASINPAATSIREMGPGSMRDTMDSMCSSHNHQKACGLPKSLRDHLVDALREARTHAAIFTAFTGAAEERSPEKVASTLQAVEHFEGDMNPQSGRPCPYKDDGNDMSAEYIAELAEKTDEGPEPESDAVDTTAETQHANKAPCEDSGCTETNCSPSTPPEEADADELGRFVLRGFKIEDMRAKSKAGVIDEPAECDASSPEVMARAVLAFKEDQQRLMPTIFIAIAGQDALPDQDEACAAQLCLPSELSPALRAECPALVAMEISQREPRMRGALNRLRSLLQLRTYINKSKKATNRSQGAKTRARDAQIAVDKRINVAAEEYRRHRAAYLALVGSGDWEKRYRVLLASDIRGLGDRTVEQIEQLSQHKAKRFVELTEGGVDAAATRTHGIQATSGQTKHVVSWLWYNVQEDDSMEITDDLMIEWCKARARAQRWFEEVVTLWCEMQSVLEACEQEAKAWDARALKAQGPLWVSLTPSLEPETRKALEEYNDDSTLAAGLRAYALKQAHIYRKRARTARALFNPLKDDVELFLETHSEAGWQWDLDSAGTRTKDAPASSVRGAKA